MIRCGKQDVKYIIKEQQYNSITKMINDLRGKDPEQIEKGVWIYKIVNNEVNAPFEGIIILVKGGGQGKTKHTIHLCILDQT